MQCEKIATLQDTEADAALGMTRGGNRYGYDEALCPQGWEQYDTDQDAWYFGVWVNVQGRQVFTYAEGDRILEMCHTQEEFAALLRSMAEFYGKAPPFAVGFGDDGKAEFYAPRPGEGLLAQTA